MSNALTRHIAANGLATLTLTRPERHNAFDDGLIVELTAELAKLDADPAVRVVILAAAGKSFSAGADLAWMKRMASYGESENLEDARKLAKLMHTLDTLSKPTVAAVQGPAYGGGVGLVACCDMVFAAPEAMFALTEVKLGLIPAVISPYVVRKIGNSQARRYFLSAERFSADTALRLGLVHEIAPQDEVTVLATSWATQLLNNGPASMLAAKRLVAEVSNRPICSELNDLCAQRIASQRVSPEGQEGLTAFLEKRPPNWVKH
ncbi:enoyl-CoA hydratase/isomerase family protein [Chitinimonas arctica]|uniref:Enoyl-CoA hydratase/isomerase family protein n=1 Tax=Chitinimonas arctica TaxID=2594795 RepID=A0A516SCL3_9NEIS|nr:enoyl-CoA hydratase/isomerase family protein [Chitinimonas arctica]QDQ25886.1 enoyl-CoA hydratase/isomerase family protein [Chitinimonas arctica]